MHTTPLPHVVFFGTPDIGVWVLEELERAGIVPSLIVTNPDAPKGRKLEMTPSPVAVWAKEHGIETLKPASLKSEEVVNALRNSGCELFIVAAYGKIIPKEILDIPKHGVVNVHPSLLPKLRGASPIRSAILENVNPTGVSVMLLTEGLDEGPILVQEEVKIPEEHWPMQGRMLDELLAQRGGKLLAETLPRWIAGEITPKEQERESATYSVKITKEMGLLDLTADPNENLRKIRAFDGWPGTYFFYEKNRKQVRVKVLDAVAEDGELRITKVVPEGRSEMDFDVFENS